MLKFIEAAGVKGDLKDLWWDLGYHVRVFRDEDYLQPPIFSVRQNAEEIAKKSFEVMYGILEKNKSFAQELIKPELILR